MLIILDIVLINFNFSTSANLILNQYVKICQILLIPIVLISPLSQNKTQMKQKQKPQFRKLRASHACDYFVKFSPQKLKEKCVKMTLQKTKFLLNFFFVAQELTTKNLKPFSIPSFIIINLLH